MSATSFKGAPFVSMRELIRARGPEFEQVFLEKLLPKEKEVYLNALAVTRVEDDTSSGEKSIFYVAARMLFPEAAKPVRELGKAIANCEIKGVYRIFFRMASMEFVLNRVAKIWRQYNDQGVAVIENYKMENRFMTCDFVVRDFPEFSEVRKEYLAGYFTALVEYARGKILAIETPRDYHLKQESRWRVKAQF
ncbi:MAG: hypothetical protein AB1439_11720 [candidate division FCPU426 bacterium]